MTTLAERLREHSHGDGDVGRCRTCEEAANRIAALERVVAAARIVAESIHTDGDLKGCESEWAHRRVSKLRDVLAAIDTENTANSPLPADEVNK